MPNSCNDIAFIGLGSNMGDSVSYLNQSLELIKQADGLNITDISPIYYTEPQGFNDQPWFTNQVIRLEYTKDWQANNLLLFLQSIEQTLGRVRSTQSELRYGPRCIDLVLFGTKSQPDPVCTIPHPHMCTRAFVLIPLRDVCRKDILPFEINSCLEKLDYKLEGNKIYQSI